MTTSLQGGLSSLQASTALLSSSLAILEAGVSDFPRLTKVLSQTRHFELLPSSTLSSAQDALLVELTPEVESLLTRAETYVERLERKENSLKARWQLQEGRLGMESEGRRKDNTGHGAKGGPKKSGMGDAGGGKLDNTGAREELKAKQLRQKKDRLSYAVERLTMQAQQTERKLRQSMAAQERKVHEDDDDDELA